MLHANKCWSNNARSVIVIFCKNLKRYDATTLFGPFYLILADFTLQYIQYILILVFFMALVLDNYTYK